MNIAVSGLTGAAAITPIAATTLSSLPAGAGDDPVFAAIAAHRKAFEADQEAHTHSRRLRAEFETQRDPRGIYLGEYPETEMKFTGSFEGEPPLPEMRKVPTGRMEPRYAEIPREIDDNVPADCADAETWKAEKHAEWERWAFCPDGSPSSLAYDAWNAAGRRLTEATAGLNVRPTTMAGIVALLRYVAESYDGDEEDDGDGRVWDSVMYAEDYDHQEGDDREPIIDNKGLLQEILEMLAETVQSLAIPAA